MAGIPASPPAGLHKKRGKRASKRRHQLSKPTSHPMHRKRGGLDEEPSTNFEGAEASLLM